MLPNAVTQVKLLGRHYNLKVTPNCLLSTKGIEMDYLMSLQFGANTPWVSYLSWHTIISQTESSVQPLKLPPLSAQTFIIIFFMAAAAPFQLSSTPDRTMSSNVIHRRKMFRSFPLRLKIRALLLEEIPCPPLPLPTTPPPPPTPFFQNP
ncbi:hypothetical protein CEXT_206791 [Caerostris extrusa]|uniref:Uncharacterized protein n=1 Tax=Caerostris extrusa TaxID=172846 RepID=A0AAV4W2L1_CAEEX|nr:hypothetical protein CEXT_206791 [Caerostris extrusa]